MSKSKKSATARRLRKAFLWSCFTLVLLGAGALAACPTLRSELTQRVLPSAPEAPVVAEAAVPVVIEPVDDSWRGRTGRWFQDKATKTADWSKETAGDVRNWSAQTAEDTGEWISDKYDRARGKVEEHNPLAVKKVGLSILIDNIRAYCGCPT